MTQPMTVPLAGLGYFPSATASARVLGRERRIRRRCDNLASGVDFQLSQLGIAPEVRPYIPHLTLGQTLLR